MIDIREYRNIKLLLYTLIIISNNNNREFPPRPSSMTTPTLFWAHTWELEDLTGSYDSYHGESDEFEQEYEYICTLGSREARKHSIMA